MQTMLVCSKAHWKFQTLRSSTLHKWNEGRSLIYDRNGPTELTVPTHTEQGPSPTPPTNPELFHVQRRATSHTRKEKSFSWILQTVLCIKLLVFDIYPLLAKIKLCYIHGLNFPIDTHFTIESWDHFCVNKYCKCLNNPFPTENATVPFRQSPPPFWKVQC